MTRFTHLERLMLVGQLSKTETLELFRQYAACWEEYEYVFQEKRKPIYPITVWNWRRKQRLAELELRADALEAEITDRYKGLFKQICLRGGIADAPQCESVVVEVWESVRDKWAEDMALTVRDHREFSRWFWEACSQHFPGDIAPLKVKFMLRPFVDELPSQPERDALLTRVYGDRTRPRTDDRALDDLLEPACDLLHQQLLQHAPDLDVLTDGEMPRESLEGITSPFEFYVGLLFPRRDTTDGRM